MIGKWLEQAEDGILFFQAEDGIRDSVASRGLGDVYERQASTSTALGSPHILSSPLNCATGIQLGGLQRGGREAVSSTHLTLPTT